MGLLFDVYKNYLEKYENYLTRKIFLGHKDTKDTKILFCVFCIFYITCVCIRTHKWRYGLLKEVAVNSVGQWITWQEL